MKERILMSEKGLKRFNILTEVKGGKLKQSKAAKILGITPRQVIPKLAQESAFWRD